MVLRPKYCVLILYEIFLRILWEELLNVIVVVYKDNGFIRTEEVHERPSETDILKTRQKFSFLIFSVQYYSIEITRDLESKGGKETKVPPWRVFF